MFRCLFFLFLIIFSTATNAAKILCYFPNPSKSHVILALPIAEELARRGHELTVVTNQKFGLGGPNYKEIVIPSIDFTSDVVKMMSSGKDGKSLRFYKIVIEQFAEANVKTLKSEKFQKILSTESFDLVFFISTFFNDFQIGIADHFKAPWIALTPLGNTMSARNLLGTHSLAATVPSGKTGFPSEMDFVQRIFNAVALSMEYLVVKFFEYKESQIYSELWPSPHYRSYDEMKKNMSLIFLNGHWIDSGVIRPTLPNEIEIGGIQISPKPKPLEAEVQKFLDDAKDGVILWTFGTNLKLSQIDPEKLKIIFKVLGGLKQKVIMRWESDDTSMLPKNFMARKWLAQDSILSHKNVKVFITHGGHGGTMEAMYHQVPIFGVPFFGDQEGNMAKAKEDGWGLGMKIYEITEENFSEAILDLLNNPKYKEKVKDMSQDYRNRLATPLDEATFWVEYILKYHGAPHLNYSGKKLNTFQMLSLDVVLFFVGVFYATWLVLKAGVKLIFGFGKKAVKKNVSKKKN